MMIPDKKAVELIENVAVTKTAVERLETKVDKHTERITNLEKICANGAFRLDAKTILKYGVIALIVLSAGGAGGHGVAELIKLILGG